MVPLRLSTRPYRWHYWGSLPKPSDSNMVPLRVSTRSFSWHYWGSLRKHSDTNMAPLRLLTRSYRWHHWGSQWDASYEQFCLNSGCDYVLSFLCLLLKVTEWILRSDLVTWLIITLWHGMLYIMSMVWSRPDCLQASFTWLWYGSQPEVSFSNMAPAIMALVPSHPWGNNRTFNQLPDTYMTSVKPDQIHHTHPHMTPVRAYTWSLIHFTSEALRMTPYLFGTNNNSLSFMHPQLNARVSEVKAMTWQVFVGHMFVVHDSVEVLHLSSLR